MSILIIRLDSIKSHIKDIFSIGVRVSWLIIYVMIEFSNILKKLTRINRKKHIG